MRKWVSILMSGLFSFALWWEWYSDNAFRAAWLADLYIGPGKIAAQKEGGLGSTVWMTLIAYLLLSLGVHYFFYATFADSFKKKAAQALLLWSLVIIPVLYLDFLWEFRKIDLLYLDGAHLACVYAAIVCVAHLLKAGPAPGSVLEYAGGRRPERPH